MSPASVLSNNFYELIEKSHFLSSEVLLCKQGSYTAFKIQSLQNKINAPSAPPKPQGNFNLRKKGKQCDRSANRERAQWHSTKSAS